jgi:hypothetical protein
LFYGREQTAAVEQEIVIKDETNEYTPEFVELLNDYYLYL